MSALITQTELDTLILNEGSEHVLQMITGGAFEGADRLDMSMLSWAPAMRSADGDMMPDKTLADMRGRDANRNDANVRQATTIKQSSIVGARYMLNSKPTIAVLKQSDKRMDDTWAEEFQEEIEAKFGLWAESTENWPDASGKMSFSGMIRLGVGIMGLTQECLLTVEWLRDQPRLFNTAFNFVSLDRLRNPMDKMMDPRIRGGVQLNQFGAAQGFHIMQAHPTDVSWTGANYKTDYIPKYKPWGRLQVLYLHTVDREEQTRGMTRLVNALREIRQLRRYRDVVLQNAVLQATYAATIESTMNAEAVYAQLGAGSKAGKQTLGKAMGSFGLDYMEAVHKYVGSSRMNYLDGVKVPHLFPGTSLKLNSVTTPGGMGTNFDSHLLRYIATSLDVPYEEMANNYADTNYSSLRASANSFWKHQQVEKATSADPLATMMFRCWLEEALAKNQITSMPSGYPSWYEGQHADAYTNCEWIGGARGMIDELKESQGAVLRISANLSTLEREYARQGLDWRSELRQRAREKKLMEELGIDDNDVSQNMQNSLSGTPADRTGSGDDADGSGPVKKTTKDSKKANAHTQGGTLENLFLDNPQDKADSDVDA